MKDLEISLTGKVILIGVLVFPLLMLFGYIYFVSKADKRSDKEVYLDDKLGVFLSGNVDSIFRLKMNHNTLTLKVSSEHFYVPSDWENKFEIGDSISKRKGELTLKHYRDGKLIETLDYKDVARNLK
ncbi:hypothetical protein [Flavobacterium sp. NKUCC04_CG]|uniref:hypothetical protein n=1 Tax=Flavobacterium sp. NKUCC04_CG TaxID=2842121 RepID=UPI001C5B8FE8|nr:hypothetical protein [Flavobacterium sp. NKUCC04_CG]MBW3520495.1 hypothetical protein [Flavobacterium sp. NKUCC04_CG]